MNRVLADLLPDDLRWLDAYAAEPGESRAAGPREPVSTYRAQAQAHAGGGMEWLEHGFGLWARVGIAFDFEYYEQVRAEPPDCVTAEDDRERTHYLALMRKRDADGDAPDA